MIAASPTQLLILAVVGLFAGWVNTVAGACWGPCVAPTACAPLRCGMGNTCPAPWRCEFATGFCVYGG